jgi:hypothetical protein
MKKSYKELITKSISLFILLAFLIIPILFFVIENYGKSEIGLIEGYTKFFSSISWFRYLLSNIFLTIGVVLVLLFAKYIFELLQIRKTVIIVVSILSILILDFFLEHPAYLGFDLFFPKTLSTKFVYTSNEFHYNLSPKDKFEIYTLLIKENTPYFIKDSLSNSAGNKNHNNDYKIALEQDVKNLFLSKWKETNSKSKLLKNISLGIGKHSVVIEGYSGIYTFSPIKKIGDKIYVGYDCFIAPLGSHGSFLEIEKVKNKWVINTTISTWVS